MSKITDSRLLLTDVFRQPDAVLNILKQHLDSKNKIVIETFGEKAPIIFSNVHRIQIITTSKNYYAGLMAKYWLEEISGIPCQVEGANHYLGRMKVIESNKLCVILSDTGEETETIEALFYAKDLGYTAIFSICNIEKSTVMLEADLILMTGYNDFKINNAQTFTTQLAGLFLLSIALGKYHRLAENHEKMYVKKLEELPNLLHQVLMLNTEIKEFGNGISKNRQAIYLGRDIQLPIAMEGASKLKELSNMYASAHSPDEFQVQPIKNINLVTFNLPVVAIAPSYDFFEKWKVFFQKFQKFQYNVFAFTDKRIEHTNSTEIKIFPMPVVDRLFSPIVYTIAMQLLACYVGITE